MLVQDIMTKEPVACEASDSIEHAARLMRDKNVGCVVALTNNAVVGILTDRDITLCLADGRTDCTVEEAMTTAVGRVHPEDDVFHAVDAFRSAGVVRRLPVVNRSDNLVGLVSVSDLAVVAEDLMGAIMLEETSNSRKPHLLTGAKEMVKRMRRPSKADAMPRREIHAVGPTTVEPTHSGR